MVSNVFKFLIASVNVRNNRGWHSVAQSFWPQQFFSETSQSRRRHNVRTGACVNAGELTLPKAAAAWLLCQFGLTLTQ